MKFNINIVNKSGKGGLIKILIGIAITLLLNYPLAILLLSAYSHFVQKRGSFYDSAVVSDPLFNIIRVILTVILFFLFVIRPIKKLTKRERRLKKIIDKRINKQQKSMEKKNRTVAKKMNKRLMKKMKSRKSVQIRKTGNCIKRQKSA